MDDFVRVNGLVISAKSCIFTLEGVPYSGIIGSDYSDKLDVETVHDMQRSGVPVGSTPGEYSVDSFKLTVLMDTWIAKMKPHLDVLGLAHGGLGFGAARFTYNVAFQEGPIVGVDTLIECRIVGNKTTVQQGTGKLVKELDCWSRLLICSGTSLADLMRQP